MKQILKQTQDRKPEEVTSLAITSYPVSKMPNDVIAKLKEFGNLEELSIDSCGLRSMENFEKMEKLKKLEMIDNFVTTNTLKQIAQRFPNLEVLILCGNYIFNLKEMEPLVSLKKLKVLDVTTNQIREPDIEHQLFKMLPNLEVCNGVNGSGEKVEKNQTTNTRMQNEANEEEDEDDDEDDEEYLEDEEMEEEDEKEDEIEEEKEEKGQNLEKKVKNS